MRALGVDPGSRATGYGVVESSGSELRCITFGVIRPAGATLADRLAEIHAGVASVRERFAPGCMVLEAVFAARNPRSALVLGQARGAALAAGGQTGLALYEYTPAEVKSAVVGQGRAAKGQVQHMVRLLLGLPRAPAEDAADALAVAICHLQRSRFRAAVARATDEPPPAGVPDARPRRRGRGLHVRPGPVR